MPQLSMQEILPDTFVAHGCGSIFFVFVDALIDRALSVWKRAFGDSAWFGETLPDRFPTARRCVFAWKPQSFKTSPLDVVQDAAQCLLVEWARLDIDVSRDSSDYSTSGTRQRRHSMHRPVIFVGHGLGGLVVQKVRLGRDVEVF